MKIDTYLGFDVGTKRTGVAIANSLTRQAKGIKVVSHQKNGAIHWETIDYLINTHTPDLLVVGLPLVAHNKEQEMSYIARSFARKLEKRYHIEVVFIDEYLSSFEAKKQLKYNHYHPNAQRGNIDQYSSQLILQTWLNENRLN